MGLSDAASPRVSESTLCTAVHLFSHSRRYHPFPTRTGALCSLSSMITNASPCTLWPTCRKRPTPTFATRSAATRVRWRAIRASGCLQRSLPRCSCFRCASIGCARARFAAAADMRSARSAPVAKVVCIVGLRAALPTARRRRVRTAAGRRRGGAAPLLALHGRGRLRMVRAVFSFSFSSLLGLR